MGLTADELLAAPRGRSLCLAVAAGLDDRVVAAAYDAELRPDDQRTLERLAAAVAAVDTAAVGRSTDLEPLIDPLGVAVNRAMAWQEPDGADLLTAHPVVAAALRPVADDVAAAPAAAWFDSPLDRDDQRYTSRYDHDHPAAPPDLAAGAERLLPWRRRALADEQRARRERPDDPTAAISGVWWSTPDTDSRLTTTRAVPPYGSVNLLWEEDSFEQDDAAIWPIAISGAPRVYEIDRPQAWGELVRRYPLEVTASRRQDWYRATGRDARWLIPDYVAVAADWDAIHLSVAGYLTTAIRAVELGDGAATVLAGWDPDQTWWLTGVGLELGPGPEHWHRDLPVTDGDPGWRRTA